MKEIVVTAANDQEARAGLALLPEARGVPVEMLIARRDGAFAGAAAVHWRSWATPAGFPAGLHVLPAHRRRGVGRALLAALAELAAEETDGLYTHIPIEADGEAERFLRACGARLHGSQRHFDASIEALLDHLTPLLQRVKRRAGGQGEMAVVPLALAPSDEIAWMVAHELGGGPVDAERRVRARAAMAPDGGGAEQGLDRSQVILREGHAAGVIIWRLTADGAAMVDARIVARRWRGGPLNLMLLEAGLLRGKAEGLSRVRFYCDDSVPDTIRLARRCNAVETRTLRHYYYPIRDRRPLGEAAD